MAPSRTNRHEGDYGNIGVQGRKTGVTLKDTGIRDEHGLELLPSFSSPEKSPPKLNGTVHNSTMTDEEDMDIGHSTIPDPTEILTARRNRQSKAILPPPRARSPIKTALNSSPRRSVGPASSPAKRQKDTPTRAMSQPLVNRKLDFSMEELRPSIEGSPQRGQPQSGLPSSATSKIQKTIPARGRKRLFDLSAEYDEDGEENETMMNGVDSTETRALTNNDSLQPILDDESLQMDQNIVDQDNSEHDQSRFETSKLDVQSEAPMKGKRGRKPKAPIRETSINLEPEASVSAIKRIRGRGRPPRHESVEVESFDASQISVAPEVKRRIGRPPKNKGLDMSHDKGVDDTNDSERPAKRVKHTSTEVTPVKRKGGKPPPSERNPNARIVSAKKPAPKASSAEPSAAPSRGERPAGRSLFLLRSETPADDDGARVLRSGRTSVKPLAYWRNERLIYGDASTDGKTLDLPSIKEVIRTKEIEQWKQKRTRPKPRGGRKKLALQDVTEEDEDMEEWEMEQVPVKRGEVMVWDPAIGKGDEERVEETELAYATAAIETREVKGTEFRYAKTLTLPFFGSGLVDLPPGGTKRAKNSRKMQLVFFVFYGRVMVKIGDTSFSIGKGGVWQVPRGNFYSIANHYENPARMFFAQGCEVAASGEIETAE